MVISDYDRIKIVISRNLRYYSTAKSILVGELETENHLIASEHQIISNLVKGLATPLQHMEKN